MKQLAPGDIARLADTFFIGSCSQLRPGEIVLIVRHVHDPFEGERDPDDEDTVVLSASGAIGAFVHLPSDFKSVESTSDA